MDHELATLVEMFPDRCLEDLHAALKSSKYIMDDACAMLLSEQQQPRANPVEELQAMFPDVDANTVRQVFKEQGSSDNAVAELLNHSLIIEESKEQKKRENENERSSNSSFSGPEQCIQIVQKYTDTTDAAAKQASYRSSFCAAKAIIATVESHQVQANPEKPARTVESKKLFTGPRGRVQGPSGIAHANSFMVLQPKDNSDSTSEVEQPYVYSKESLEGQELEDAIQSNLDLRSINPKFLRHALEFYKGDLHRTLSLAMFILDHRAAHYTHTDPPQSTEPPNISGFIRLQTRRRRSSTGSTSPFNPSLWDDQLQDTANRMVQDVLVSPRLDFHGFLCNDALLVLHKCLNKWWEEELTQRELHNQKLSMSQVANVSPLTVITGRGIHSDNGVSKLKREVRKFLDKNDYKYHEDTAYFVVLGKKSR
ncbi:uncharacterized protein ZBAI_09548 [Zygosaccharomyces bailii ISA1307]|nr:uncharacterized protein ZBAI_09548 [Zygosaccharomyces bailii ISA1307]